MTTTPALRVVGSGSSWVHGRVAGPQRVATVLHAGRSAVYLDLDGWCVAVLAAPAVQVPCGIRTGLPVLPDVDSGDEVDVLDGRVVMPGCDVVVEGIVDLTAPVLARTAATRALGAFSDLVAPLVGDVREALPEEALDLLAAGDPGAVPALLGLGVGLTPLGDDVLCGWLATAVALRHPRLDSLRDQVTDHAPVRTTMLSATLLACASRGEGIPEFSSLLGAMADEDRPGVRQSVELLLGVGATSGAGLLLGTQLALEVAR